eukprot:TRINITY_DN40256_c0_g1_i1.p1 TRINITY_DN40256_c0_g1~~TRINITY_DN40256_c0_g1_i1.p1  ORF type:complete len:309 (+),score=83.98 TRINITY_DN40256_c0_g1_i1:218-1144(+)
MRWFMMLGRIAERTSASSGFGPKAHLLSSGCIFKLHQSSYSYGPSSSPFQSGSSTGATDDFEQRMFGDRYDSADSFFRKLDKLEKARARTSNGLGIDDWNMRTDEEADLEGLTEDTLNDGMDERLKRAALNQGYGSARPERDYSFRPDVLFDAGTTYSIQDLDLTKPVVRKSFRKSQMFETTSKEVLMKADFRNVKFLQKFISEAGMICPRKKFQISARAQRKLVREIKTARSFGLMPFTCMGTKPFVYGKTMEDKDQDYYFDQYKDAADDVQDDDGQDDENDGDDRIRSTDTKQKPKQKQKRKQKKK